MAEHLLKQQGNMADMVDSMGLNFQEYWSPEDTIHFFVSIGQKEPVMQKLAEGIIIALPALCCIITSILKMQMWFTRQIKLG